eukprot:TRINITY_DN2952_c0_g1_i1.p1 TRINITY_DN2952_c0_g1~~TRINITY_DN2952_c0_g1_i1.p1  ORF type:complete len:572 (-),score=151.65 TRINITY_DN2952_c0_g1_i1:42-1637(-)
MNSEITPWLKNQTVFLTGATGFLGKVIIWKLLNEAGDDLKIYALVRPSQRGGSATQRLQSEVFSAAIFNDILLQRPHLKERVTAVEGDITKENFGMSPSDLETVEKEVSVIIHSAATTRFTERFKLAIELNTWAVQRVVQIAKRCPKLVSLLHISTCYVGSNNTSRLALDEKIFNTTKFSPYDLIEKTRNMTADEADRLWDSMQSGFPNTYTFTKGLGEQILESERANLPVSIVRPSIVTASLKEPVPGWVDVLLGPGGLFLAVGMGALRVMHGSSNNVADFIPVDIVVNAIIASAWRHATDRNPEPASHPVPIYQIGTSDRHPVKWLHPRMIVPQYFVRYPPKRNFGPPLAFFCHAQWSFRLMDIIMHWIPATLADGYRLIQGKKPFNVRSMQKVSKAVDSLTHFTANSWHFISKNADQLQLELNEDDRNLYFQDVRVIDWDVYFMVMLHGMRRYILKEGEEDKKTSTTAVQAPAQGIFQKVLGYLRPYLFLISLGCFLYFFRQNLWALRIKLRQMRQNLGQTLPRLLSQ